MPSSPPSSPQRAILGMLLTATAVGAQQNAWDIPHRGAIVYDRVVEKFEVSPGTSRLRLDQVMVSATDGGHEWRYFAGAKKDIPAGFELPGFDDSGWRTGRGEFGTETETLASQRTPWASEALCLRTSVIISRKPKALVMDVDHDDGIRIWLNGALVVSNDGWGRDRRYVIAGDALDAWKRGDNLITARCINTGGTQYCDISIASLLSLPPGVRGTDNIQKALQEARSAANKVHRELFGDYRAPGLLLQGELDKNRYVRIPPTDLRDIAWWIATDLRHGAKAGSISNEAPRMFRLGDLEVRGRAGQADAEGWQEIEAKVRNLSEPKLRGDSKKHVKRHILPFVWYGFDGVLKIRRRLERGKAGIRVAEFETELVGSVLRGKQWKQHVADLVQRESWRLTAVRENQDATFRSMVQKAIDSGIKRLREQLEDVNKGDLAPENPNAGRSYHSGRLALGLLALVKGGLPKEDEVVQRCLAALRKRTLVDTYSLGNALMALEAFYAPSSELGDLRAGTINRPRKRMPSAEDKALMQKWTDRLLANVDAQVDATHLLRFHYVGGGGFDNSVNQYGLLGLYSAHLCGIEIKDTVWKAAAVSSLSTAGWARALAAALTARRQASAPPGFVTRAVQVGSSMMIGASTEAPSRSMESSVMKTVGLSLITS